MRSQSHAIVQFRLVPGYIMSCDTYLMAPRHHHTVYSHRQSDTYLKAPQDRRRRRRRLQSRHRRCRRRRRHRRHHTCFRYH